jgi:hypothetical protein
LTTDYPIEEVDGRTYPSQYYRTERGNYLCINGYFFLRNTISNNSMSWRCTCYRSFKCKARARTEFSKPDEAVLNVASHTHTKNDQKSIRRHIMIEQKLSPSLFKNDIKKDE